MLKLTSERVLELFENNEDILVVWKCEKERNKIIYSDAVPLGFEAIVNTTNNEPLYYHENNRMELRDVSNIADLWFVKVQITCVPWGVADILYTDRVHGHEKKFGVSGEFDFEVKNSRGLVENFNEAKQVTAIKIKNDLLPKMRIEVDPILSRHASEQGFDRIDKNRCANEIKGRLLNLFRDEYSLHLNRFTIDEMIEN